MTRSPQFLFFLLALVALLSAGCRLEYQVGYDQAVEDVCEARREGSLASEIGMMVVDELEVPVHSGHSGDWNRGYRDGFRAERLGQEHSRK